MASSDFVSSSVEGAFFGGGSFRFIAGFLQDCRADGLGARGFSGVLKTSFLYYMAPTVTDGAGKRKDVFGSETQCRKKCVTVWAYR